MLTVLMAEQGLVGSREHKEGAPWRLASVLECVPPRQTLGKSGGPASSSRGCSKKAGEEAQSAQCTQSVHSVTLGTSEELRRDTSGPSSWWPGGWGLHPPTLTPHRGKCLGPSTCTLNLPTDERASVLLEKARRQRRRKWTFHSQEECREGTLSQDSPGGPRGRG